MAANTAELTLIIKAKNLADAELAKVKEAIGGLATKASSVADSMANAFKGIGRRIGNAMGNIASDVLSGGSVTRDLLNLGALMAGTAVEGLIAHFVPGIVAKLAGTAAFAPLVAALTAEGITLGGVVSGAIVLGMAALPALLTAAVLGAIAVAIANGRVSLEGGKVPQGAGKFGAPPSSLKYYNERPEKKASGGWVGLHGPQMVLAGERGPEYVVPNHQLGQSKAVEGVRILGVSEQQILDMVDRGLYFRLQRAAPTPQRT